MNSGTWIVTPLLSLAGLVLAVLVAVFMIGAVSTTSSSAVAGSMIAIGRPLSHSAWKVMPGSIHWPWSPVDLVVERVLVVVLRVHDVDAVAVAIHDLHFLGVEPRVLDELGGAEPGVEGVAAGEVPEPDLDERAQVARGAVLEIHDPARLAVDDEHVAAADVACLHRSEAPENGRSADAGGGAAEVENTPRRAKRQSRVTAVTAGVRRPGYVRPDPPGDVPARRQ